GDGADSQLVLTVVPPSWRPDLLYPRDLAEEVIRLEGYENIPVRMPRAAAGRGLTAEQRRRRATGRALADAGYVEVLSQPFGSAADHDRLLLPADDPRRRALAVANPLRDDEPLLRTTLLSGLLRVLARNAGRGFSDVALFEMGLVFRPRPESPGIAPILRVDRGPTEQEVASLEAELPDQALGVGGGAGELHPRVTAAFDLAPRTCAMELDLTVIETAAASLGPAQAPVISPYPVATQDVALVVPETVPAADVEAALVAGVAGSDQPDLLEEVRLFDVYTGAQAGEGGKSLAYTLRFRAPDRTLTVEETTAAREAAVAEAARRVGAVPRGGS